MIFPYGEWIILCLAIVTWVEKRTSRRLFLSLTIAWVIGKGIEVVMPSTMPWHWHFARMAVLMVFWIWALQRAERRIMPLLSTSLIISMETLFIVNNPGIVPYGSWIFSFVLLVVAWLTTKCYWGAAAAFTGSVLLNQALVRFTHEGIVRYADLPETFIWNFGVGILVVWAGLRLGWQHYAQSVMLKKTAKQILPVNGVGTYEHSEELELQ